MDIDDSELGVVHGKKISDELFDCDVKLHEQNPKALRRWQTETEERERQSFQNSGTPDGC